MRLGLRLERAQRSFLGVAGLASAVVVAFFSGLVASGTFWYALFLAFQSPSFSPTLHPVFILFGASAATTCVFTVAGVMLRQRLPMKYIIFSFIMGGLLAATTEIIGFGISAWASWVTTTGG